MNPTPTAPPPSAADTPQPATRRDRAEPPATDRDLERFLRVELNLSQRAIALALDRCHRQGAPLPAVLWEYGLVDLKRLDRLFDWLARHGSPSPTQCC